MEPVLIQLIDAECTQEATQLILGGTDVNVCDSAGRSPLYAAVAGANLRLVELLLMKGANVNAVMPQTGVSVLMRSFKAFGKTHDAGAILVALIRSGADVNAKTNFGYSVYDIAQHCEVPESLKLFILMRGASSTAMEPVVVGTATVETRSFFSSH